MEFIVSIYIVDCIIQEINDFIGFYFVKLDQENISIETFEETIPSTATINLNSANKSSTELPECYANQDENAAENEYFPSKLIFCNLKLTDFYLHLF